LDGIDVHISFRVFRRFDSGKRAREEKKRAKLNRPLSPSANSARSLLPEVSFLYACVDLGHSVSNKLHDLPQAALLDKCQA
jgi:hypothetical protein